MAPPKCVIDGCDEIDALKSELLHEERLRDTIEWSNSELENSIHELELEISQLSVQNATSGPVNEWKVRLESQLALNEQLDHTKRWLETELAQVKNQIKSGSKLDLVNLDDLTETELIRYVKHMERTKTDLTSQLRDNEWKLDKEGKEYHRLSEIRGMYQAELRHYTRTLDRIKQKKIHGACPDHTAPPSSLARWSINNGIRSNQRIIDPKKGPIRRTVGVRSLPKLQPHSKGFRKKTEDKESNNASPEVNKTPESSKTPETSTEPDPGTDPEQGTDDSGVVEELKEPTQ